jgi:pentatricopeptide repeat protein
MAIGVQSAAGVRPDVVACNALMHAFSRAHRVEDAARVMRAMIANKVRPNMTTYNTLLDAYARVRLLKPG